MCDISTLCQGTVRFINDIEHFSCRRPYKHVSLDGWVCLFTSGALVWKTWWKITVHDNGCVFSLRLVEANRIRPKGFHVLCSHSPWGNDVKLKVLVSLCEFKMIMKDFKADSIRNRLFFV